MKFMMVFQAVDKATKVMNKIMAAEKKTAASLKAGAKTNQAAVNGATQATQKQVSVFSKLGSAARNGFKGVVSGARAASRAVVTLHNQTIRLGKAGFDHIQTGAGKAMRGVVVAAGLATAAFGASTLAAHQLTGVASQFEKFQTILETTEGSSEKARDAMAWVTDFAVKTPYELDEVMESFVKLRAYGLDPTSGLLNSLGDTSAAMGKPVMQAVEAIADAVTGENERLKEFGIRASKNGSKITYEYTNAAGKMSKASVKASDRVGIQMKLMEIFNEKYGGAMDKLSRTWQGMTSNLADLWLKFQLAIMNAGLFDWMKAKLQMVLDTVDQLQASGDLDKWAAQIGQNIQFVLESAWQFATQVYSVLQTLGTYLVAAKDYVGSWERLAVILGAMALAPVLISTAAGIVQIALGITMLSAALLANPIVLIIAAVVAGAAAIYFGWEPIKAFFVGLWDGIASAASAAWSAISSGAAAAWAAMAEWLGFDPVAMLASAWANLSEPINEALSSVSAAVSTGWETIKVLFNWSPLEVISSLWAGLSTSLSDPLNLAFNALSMIWETIKALFAWSPAGMIVANWNGIANAAQGALDTALSFAQNIWNRIKALFDWSPVEAIRNSWADISGVVGDIIEGVAIRAGQAWAGVKSIFSFGSSEADAAINITDPATIEASRISTEALRADMQAVAAIDTSPAMSRLAALESAARQAGSNATGAIRQAEAFLNNVSFYNQGVALMDTMAAGIRARAGVVIAEIQKMAQAVRDHLPSSPAKTGPLSDIHRLKFAETIAQSIKPAPMVKAMRGAAAATMAAASLGVTSLPVSAEPVAGAAVRAQVAQSQASTVSASQSGGSVHVEYKPTLNLSGDAKAAEASFRNELDSHARHIARLVEEERRKEGRKTA